MKKVKQTTNNIKVYTPRVITLTISICLALVGMSVLKIIDLPDMLIRFVGYLLIVSAVVYILKNYK